MTTIKMIKQTKMLEIIIICILAKTLYGKSINTIQDKESQQKHERIKRGYSHYGGNDFGSSVQVSSGVLQYGGGDEHSISSDTALSAGHFDTLDFSSISADHSSGIESIGHLDSSASSADPWSASGLSSGYEVWLEPLPDYHASSGLDSSSIHTSSITSTHPGSDHIANAVFSDASAHSQSSSSQLHTKIASDSIGSSIHDHDNLAISDNLDFNNVSDLRTKHYTESYGK